jgi:hypothetical protein
MAVCAEENRIVPVVDDHRHLRGPLRVKCLRQMSTAQRDVARAVNWAFEQGHGLSPGAAVFGAAVEVRGRRCSWERRRGGERRRRAGERRRRAGERRRRAGERRACAGSGSAGQGSGELVQDPAAPCRRWRARAGSDGAVSALASLCRMRGPCGGSPRSLPDSDRLCATFLRRVCRLVKIRVVLARTPTRRRWMLHTAEGSCTRLTDPARGPRQPARPRRHPGRERRVLRRGGASWQGPTPPAQERDAWHAFRGPNGDTARESCVGADGSCQSFAVPTRGPRDPAEVLRGRRGDCGILAGERGILAGTAASWQGSAGSCTRAAGDTAAREGVAVGLERGGTPPHPSPGRSLPTAQPVAAGGGAPSSGGAPGRALHR